MTRAVLSDAGNGRWRIEGELDFSTVPAVWDQLELLIEQRHELVLSLGGVQRTNSAALALLVEALDQARRHGCRLRLEEVPGDLVDLARMSRCEQFLLA